MDVHLFLGQKYDNTIIDNQQFRLEQLYWSSIRAINSSLLLSDKASFVTMPQVKNYLFYAAFSCNTSERFNKVITFISNQLRVSITTKFLSYENDSVRFFPFGCYSY